MASPDSSTPLRDKRLLLGVSGSIAAYKAALLVRLFKKAGADVQVMMTPDAARFITPLTLGTLSEREVLSEIFPENEDGSWTKHVSLGLWADLFVVAPATAQTLAKLAHGFSDSMLTATALSARCPLLVCPAMDHDMYEHPATQANLKQLEAYGYEVMPAAHGELASGLIGQGRMPEPEAILDRVVQKLADDEQTQQHGDSASSHVDDSPSPSPPSMKGMHVLVTAGPTEEPIDPARMLTNPSTGKMGYALAEVAAARGAAVTLISGPTHLATPAGVTRIDVRTADDMHRAVHEHADADLIIMAAAVADYTPAEPSEHKLKKTGDDLTLHLRRTPDILRALGEQKRKGQVLVGFALETQDGEANAREKLRAKNLDWIALNEPAANKGTGFGTDTNQVTLIGRGGYAEVVPLASKRTIAEVMLERIVSTPVAPESSAS